MKHYEIHPESRDIPNTVTGKLVKWIDLYHLVVVGTEPDDMGDLRAVCGTVVDREPWRRQLRDWLAVTEKQCPVCDKTDGQDLRAEIDLIGGMWEQQ
ncbi:MAG: hypothetical protein ABSC31_13715 [Acidimicrobiales bacterium]|jgi:hypothetical protein